METKEQLNDAQQEKEKNSAFTAVKEGVLGIGDFFKIACNYIFRMRKPIMTVPVLAAAIWLAQYNSKNLPETVGIGLQTTGEYAQMISRDAAVFAPLVVTAFCLLLMFVSKRTMYPWLISVFSLVLPLLIWVTNFFPG